MTESRKRWSVMLWSTFALLLIGAAGAWYLLDPGFRAERAERQLATDMPQAEFERRVRDYILSIRRSSLLPCRASTRVSARSRRARRRP